MLAVALFAGRPACAFDRTNEVFKIFQFPANQIPRVDGDTNDWNLVPESYVIGSGNSWKILGNIRSAMPPRRRFACRSAG